MAMYDKLNLKMCRFENLMTSKHIHSMLNFQMQDLMAVYNRWVWKYAGL